MLIEKIIDIIYPTKCPLCHEITLPRGLLAHRECIGRLKKVGRVFCLKCGKQMDAEDAGKT
ncbi:MAG: double zinc ribbon domain-containing protein, partial [Lachnospiraceae bacterium]|nr:double zinc ribbon domain-containing protein [Lachnospiraceae bacterium]